MWSYVLPKREKRTSGKSGMRHKEKNIILYLTRLKIWNINIQTEYIIEILRRRKNWREYIKEHFTHDLLSMEKYSK